MGDLRGEIGSPPQSTMRIYLKTLEGVQTIERNRQAQFQGSVEYSLTKAGRALLDVAGTLQTWLNSSPRGPIELGTPAARNAIRALVEGWSSNMIRALSAQPLSLTELSRLIPKISYPALERRLTALRLVGLVEPRKEDGRSTPYRPTDWLGRAVAVLTSASEWERECIPDITPPIGRLDVEAAFLLAVPLMSLPADMSGKVRLAVEVQGGSSPVHAGAILHIAEGTVESCSVRMGGDADASVSGTAMGWLRQMNGGFPRRFVEFGGDQALGEAVIVALRATALDAPLALEGSAD